MKLKFEYDHYKLLKDNQNLWNEIQWIPNRNSSENSKVQVLPIILHSRQESGGKLESLRQV